MNENKELKTSSEVLSDSSQKKPSSPKKKIFTFRLKLLLFFLISAYLSIYSWKIFHKQRQLSSTETQTKNDDFFDLDEEYKRESAVEELNSNQIKEKGAEFFYQTLIKNQSQIEEAIAQIQSLKNEISKYKSQEKVGRIIINYTDFREKMFNKKDYQAELQNLEILSAYDPNIQNKLGELKKKLGKYLTKKEMISDFSGIIPKIIATKNINPQKNSILDKIRYEASKLVMIRKLKDKDSKDVDAVIVAVEKNLEDHDYQSALNNMANFEEKYYPIISEFIEKLNLNIEVEKIDEEIINYLKSLI